MVFVYFRTNNDQLCMQRKKILQEISGFETNCHRIIAVGAKLCLCLPNYDGEYCLFQSDRITIYLAFDPCTGGMNRGKNGGTLSCP